MLEDAPKRRKAMGRPEVARKNIKVSPSSIDEDVEIVESADQPTEKPAKKEQKEVTREELIYKLTNRLSHNDLLFDDVEEFIESLGYTEHQLAIKYDIAHEERIIYEVRRQRRRKIAEAKANALGNPKGLELYLKANEFDDHQIHKVSPSYKVDGKKEKPKIDVRIEGGLTDEQRKIIAQQNETPE